jgi:hypothetical protein
MASLFTNQHQRTGSLLAVIWRFFVPEILKAGLLRLGWAGLLAFVQALRIDLSGGNAEAT